MMICWVSLVKSGLGSLVWSRYCGSVPYFTADSVVDLVWKVIWAVVGLGLVIWMLVGMVNVSAEAVVMVGDWM